MQNKQDDRHQHALRHVQDLARHADRGEAQRNQRDVGDEERDEHRVDQLRLRQEHGRAGVHALHVEHADHDRGDRIAGNAEHQRRHPRAGQGGIVGGAGVDQPFDMAGAEFFRLLGEPLGHGVGDPRRDVGAGARQDADRGAEHAAAQQVDLVARQHRAQPLEHIADALLRQRPSLVARGDVAQHLRDREHADHRRNEADAAHQLDAAEGEARVARGDVDADGRDEQADQQRDDALDDRPGRDDHGAGQPEAGEPEIFERRELDRELGERCAP